MDVANILDGSMHAWLPPLSTRETRIQIDPSYNLLIFFRVAFADYVVEHFRRRFLCSGLFGDRESGRCGYLYTPYNG